MATKLKFRTRAANRLFPTWLRKRLKFARAKLFEGFGSDRYSRPAMYGMDRKLEAYLPQHPGFFVECGANDGFDQSNTYYLARYRGWTGVLIEPVPALHALCAKHRPESWSFPCALGAEDHGHAEIIFSDLMSTTLGSRSSQELDRAHAAKGFNKVRHEGNYTIKAPFRTLTSILNSIGVATVDLFVLDVEGFELNVLKGVDFEAHDIRLMLIETEHPEDVAELLGERYQLAAKLSHHDYLFGRVPADQVQRGHEKRVEMA